MASACINNVAISGGWLSPRMSFSRDFIDGSGGEDALQTASEDPAGNDFLDFEFRLHDPSATMLPADELISDGKLVSLQPPAPPSGIPSPVVPEEVSGSDARVISSPRAPRCSSRWRDLLGLRRQQGARPEPAAGSGTNTRSLKQFLHRSPKSSSIDPSMSLPLLRDAESDPVSASVSSRRSLSSSSSSSGGDHDDVPRVSLDSEKPPRARISTAPPAARAAVRARRPAEAESPRMNASGRVVFERSSSSPGSFNGGPRPRPRGMERSYSANVRVTQVLNVPVRSLRRSGKPVSVLGLGPLFPPQRKGSAAAVTGGGERNGRVKIDKAPPRD